MSAPRVSGIRAMVPRPSRTATPEAAKIPEYSQRAMAPPIAGPEQQPHHLAALELCVAVAPLSRPG